MFFIVFMIKFIKLIIIVSLFIKLIIIRNYKFTIKDYSFIQINEFNFDCISHIVFIFNCHFLH